MSYDEELRVVEEPALLMPSFVFREPQEPRESLPSLEQL